MTIIICVFMMTTALSCYLASRSIRRAALLTQAPSPLLLANDQEEEYRQVTGKILLYQLASATNLGMAVFIGLQLVAPAVMLDRLWLVVVIITLPLGLVALRIFMFLTHRDPLFKKMCPGGEITTFVCQSFHF